MNAVMFKRFGLLVLGAVAGGIAGYFLAELIIDFLNDQARDEMVEEILAEEERREQSSSSEPQLKEETSLKLPDPRKAIHGQRPARNYTDYSKKEKGDLGELVAPYVANQKIGIISLHEWTENTHFDKETITYYEDDTTYCDVGDEIISDPNGMFGPNAHLHFGEGSEDPDIVYIRNEKVDTDYEISRVHNAFSVVVLGMPPGEKKLPKSAHRRNARKAVEKDENETGEIDDNEEDE